jgi:phage baseplate assembly protein W
MPTPGFAPKLPLSLDPLSGPYAPIKLINDVVKQNLKMLVLTAPGERIMIPNYGVGLRNYLFEAHTTLTKEDIESTILQQTSLFMPFLSRVRVKFDDMIDADNAVSIRISYFVKQIGQEDFIDLVLTPKMT